MTMKSALRTAVAAIATMLIALTLAGCVQREDAAETVSDSTFDVSQLADLTLQVGDQKGGTEALLRASGELEKLPFAVKFSTFTSGPPQIEAATAGKIDFAAPVTPRRSSVRRRTPRSRSCRPTRTMPPGTRS